MKYTEKYEYIFYVNANDTEGKLMYRMKKYSYDI